MDSEERNFVERMNLFRENKIKLAPNYAQTFNARGIQTDWKNAMDKHDKIKTKVVEIIGKYLSIEIITRDPFAKLLKENRFGELQQQR